MKGIATREGGLTSHAAIFARSMRIPTITDVEGLLEEVREGDFVILDAADASLRVNPDEVVREQYAETLVEQEQSREESRAAAPRVGHRPLHDPRRRGCPRPRQLRQPAGGRACG